MEFGKVMWRPLGTTGRLEGFMRPDETDGNMMARERRKRFKANEVRNWDSQAGLLCGPGHSGWKRFKPGFVLPWSPHAAYFERYSAE